MTKFACLKLALTLIIGLISVMPDALATSKASGKTVAVPSANKKSREKCLDCAKLVEIQKTIERAPKKEQQGDLLNKAYMAFGEIVERNKFQKPRPELVRALLNLTISLLKIDNSEEAAETIHPIYQSFREEFEKGLESFSKSEQRLVKEAIDQKERVDREGNG